MAGGGRLDGRIALVTGASRGIGAAVALRFAAEGATVVLAARGLAGLQQTDDGIRQAGGGIAVLAPMDLTKPDDIDRLAGAIAQRFGRLDVLVGNAAVLGTLGPMPHIDPGDWERVMATNLGANWRLIRAFERLLLASAAGRAMFVTSGAARGVFPYWGAYAVSKAALEHMVRLWAGETTKTTLRVNLIDPGVVRTAMRAQAFPGEDPNTVAPPESITNAFVELAAADCRRHGELVAAG